MLAFPLAQAQTHLNQHHSTVGKSYHMLAFPLEQAQVHLKQHHSTVGQS
jgi:hypothetical protein